MKGLPSSVTTSIPEPIILLSFGQPHSPKSPPNKNALLLNSKNIQAYCSRFASITSLASECALRLCKLWRYDPENIRTVSGYGQGMVRELSVCGHGIASVRSGYSQRSIGVRSGQYQGSILGPTLFPLHLSSFCLLSTYFVPWFWTSPYLPARSLQCRSQEDS